MIDREAIIDEFIGRINKSRKGEHQLEWEWIIEGERFAAFDDRLPSLEYQVRATASGIQIRFMHQGEFGGAWFNPSEGAEKEEEEQGS